MITLHIDETSSSTQKQVIIQVYEATVCDCLGGLQDANLPEILRLIADRLDTQSDLYPLIVVQRGLMGGEA